MPSDIVPDIPEELERITLKAMSCQLNSRYQSANELLEDLNKFTQAQIAAENKPDFENPAVAPVRSVSELSRDKFSLRRKRSGTVAYMSGAFGGLVLILCLFIFLWNFWLKEVFSPAEGIPLPNFVGSNYESIVNNADLAATYNFKVTYIIDTDTQSGMILSQNPEPGRSMMLTPDGISVELSVSTGVVLTPVPDVAGTDYREAVLELQKAGFTVDVENATSSDVPKGLRHQHQPRRQRADKRGVDGVSRRQQRPAGAVYFNAELHRADGGHGYIQNIKLRSDLRRVGVCIQRSGSGHCHRTVSGGISGDRGARQGHAQGLQRLLRRE